MHHFKLNRFDILLLVILVLLAAGTCLKFFVLKEPASQTETATVSYQLKIEDIRQYTVDALQVGDTLYDNDGKGVVGTISNIEITPADTMISRSDGTAVMGTIDNHFDAVLTITADGEITDAGYKVGNYELCTNQTGTFFTKYSIWYATITQLG